MSSHTSPLENTLSSSGIEILSPVQAVSINQVVQSAIRDLQQQKSQQQIILRCETLPVIEARPHQVFEFFRSLFSIIFQEPPTGSKLFLYIDCRERQENSNGNLMELRTYEVLISSNIAAAQQWQPRHQHTLARCHELATRMGGRLEVNTGGSLFLISLQGKL